MSESDQVPILVAAGGEEQEQEQEQEQEHLNGEAIANADDPEQPEPLMPVPNELAQLLLTPPPPFKPIRSMAWVMTGIVTCSVMIMLVFVLPIVCNKPPSPPPGPTPGPDQGFGSASSDWICTLEPLSLLLYTHVAHWIVHLFVDQALKSKHKTSRVAGHIKFYLDTKNTRRTPFYLVSIGNALLLVTITALHDYCDPNHCEDKFTKVDYLRGLITLESLTIICLWTYYCIEVNKFNKAKPLPDCLDKDRLAEIMVGPEGQVADHPQPLPNMRPDEPLDANRDIIMQRQAEMIRHLQTHTKRQGKKLLELHRRVRTATNNSGEANSRRQSSIEA